MFLIDSPNESSNCIGLVAEKITCPAELPRVSRPRLLSLIDHGLNTCTSTLLIGRAGTGKTALAVDFAETCGRQTSWYKVDAPDADLATFCRYLTASLRKTLPGFENRTLNRESDVDNQPISVLAESFVYELAEGHSEPLLIVIEDLHLICDAGWVVPFFQRLLPLLPAHVHMLITSRTTPPAPLWRMRSKQTLLMIDEETLAFTRAEANELFESYGLSCEQASIAVDHTHGRAAPLAAFAEGLNSRNGESVSSSTNILSFQRS